AEGFDPGDPNSNPAFPLEIGEVSVDHNWKRVEFNDTFIDPVVVANPLSYNGGDPAVLRIRNVESTGFDIRVQEWNYLDGTHTTENVSYIVMELGSYILEDGTKVEAGRFDADATGSFGWVDFSQTFNQVPVVTSTVSSFNEEDAVCSRLKNIDTTGFDFCMHWKHTLTHCLIFGVHYILTAIMAFLKEKRYRNLPFPYGTLLCSLLYYLIFRIIFSSKMHLKKPWFLS
ncbi:MAG: hypothetical protein LWX08_08160, partial [Deltaproteobacteria bacterium]|nr:hypothetical protein [Deltaproteobacteria bacterium]